ncbi:transporter particle component [Cryptococcus wingfieldii CBS 7118]|uniref:Transporter particle component n=1 Tax=Cryptococcus wingfieldii CBS 7118 TaxID=1295528 RepID=A0A1E3I165_9TREE|nr:transporter particle component [Cryptococcus wingfieldii CBS 7118]ODN82339.1 transporter particle component [Cryptococcus wingfieldii CBS 7118]
MSRPSSVSTTHLPIAPTIPPALHQLANPAPALIDAQLPGYLLPPVLHLLRQSSTHVVRKRRAQEEELRSEGLLPPRTQIEDEETVIEEELAKRIERIGLMAGGLIAEKLTLARPPLASHLDIIKFVCKELFLYVYSKQIDNLRTNHRGVYVLQSHSFPPLAGLSSYRGAAADMETAKTHLLFPQALLQGALTRLGMHSVVTAESSGLPQCTFQIRTTKATATTPSVAGTPNPSAGLTARGHPGAVSTDGPASVAMSTGGSASTGLGIGGN